MYVFRRRVVIWIDDRYFLTTKELPWPDVCLS